MMAVAMRERRDGQTDTAAATLAGKKRQDSLRKGPWSLRSPYSACGREMARACRAGVGVGMEGSAGQGPRAAASPSERAEQHLGIVDHLMQPSTPPEAQFKSF